ncbi:MAG: inorganic diphosphatase [bacterium]
MAYSKIPIGERAPEVVNVVVEIPRGSHYKYEYDEKFDEIRLDRVIHSPMFYPVDYGFIPQTRSEDGDHLDVLILITDPLTTGTIVSARPIGVLDIEDQGGKDWKIVAVAEKDPKMNKVLAIEEVNEHHKKEIEHFFQEYKKLENKWTKVYGWLGKDKALQILNEARKRFNKELE